jgi:hypothetical protein
MMNVHMYVCISMLVFWIVTPYGIVGRYQLFGGTYYLHLRFYFPEDNIQIFAAVRTSYHLMMNVEYTKKDVDIEKNNL